MEIAKEYQLLPLQLPNPSPSVEVIELGMLQFLHTKGMQTNSWGVNLKCSSTAGRELPVLSKSRH